MGLGALGSYFLGYFQKKKKIISKNFQFLEKIQDFQIFQRKKKRQKTKDQNFQKKKKKEGNFQKGPWD